MSGQRNIISHHFKPNNMRYIIRPIGFILKGVAWGIFSLISIIWYLNLKHLPPWKGLGHWIDDTLSLSDWD